MKHLTLFAFAACLAATAAHAESPVAAAQPAASPETVVAETRAATPATDAEAASAATEKPPVSEANCVRQTGSRIRPRDHKTACNGLPGRAYTKEDLDRTGHLNLADALRSLDSSIR
ncbi:hypothetical protein [Pseudoxanthomonas sp. LARHCG66]